MSKIAILTNDLQYDLIEKNQDRRAAVDASRETMQNFLDEIRELKQLVVHLQLVNYPDDPNVELHDGVMPVQKGTRGADILEEFLRPTDIVLEKNKDSGFFKTDLEDVLKQNNVETVVVTGMQTQICVQTTSADAYFRGFNVWVPEDAVISSRPQDKKRALTWLDEYCATISNTSEIIAILKNGDQFKRKDVYIP